MNQRRLWIDPKVRAERQARAEAFMRRPMELEPLPEKQAAETREAMRKDKAA